MLQPLEHSPGEFLKLCMDEAIETGEPPMDSGKISTRPDILAKRINCEVRQVLNALDGNSATWTRDAFCESLDIYFKVPHGFWCFYVQLWTLWQKYEEDLVVAETVQDLENTFAKTPGIKERVLKALKG